MPKKVKVRVAQKDGDIGLSLLDGEYRTFSVLNHVITAEEDEAAVLVSHGGASYLSDELDEGSAKP